MYVVLDPGGSLQGLHKYLLNELELGVGRGMEFRVEPKKHKNKKT